MVNNYYKVTRWLETSGEKKRPDSRFYFFDSRNEEEERRAADSAYKLANMWGVIVSCYRATPRDFAVIGETPDFVPELKWA